MNTRTTLTLCAIVTALAMGCSSTQENTETTAASNRGAGNASQSGRGSTSGGEDHGARNCQLASVYFDYDSSALDTRSRETLASNAQCMQRRSGNVAVTGMTDPRGTEEYNLALGDRRARTAVDYLHGLGAEGGRMRTMSAGEERATGESEAGWAQDRRAEIELR